MHSGVVYEGELPRSGRQALTGELLGGLLGMPLPAPGSQLKPSQHQGKPDVAPAKAAKGAKGIVVKAEPQVEAEEQQVEGRQHVKVEKQQANEAKGGVVKAEQGAEAAEGRQQCGGGGEAAAARMMQLVSSHDMGTYVHIFSHIK